MKVSDLLVGLASVVFGLALLGYGVTLPPMPGQRYGAGLFPILLVAVADWARDQYLVGNLFVVLGLILVYVIFSERIGFIPLSIAILIALFLRLRVPPFRSVVIAVAATALIYIAFGRFLRVPLPRGLLEGIIW